jgi:hypothetical protein
MYADDVVIIATCPKEAQLMLDEVSKVSVTHEIKFNPDKTNLMIFSPKKEDKNLSLLLCGQPIVRSESIKYLGTVITNNYNNMKHVDARRKKRRNIIEQPIHKWHYQYTNGHTNQIETVQNIHKASAHIWMRTS